MESERRVEEEELLQVHGKEKILTEERSRQTEARIALIETKVMELVAFRHVKAKQVLSERQTKQANRVRRLFRKLAWHIRRVYAAHSNDEEEEDEIPVGPVSLEEQEMQARREEQLLKNIMEMEGSEHITLALV